MRHLTEWRVPCLVAIGLMQCLVLVVQLIYAAKTFRNQESIDARWQAIEATNFELETRIHELSIGERR